MKIAELRAIAEAATPGPWAVDDFDGFVVAENRADVAAVASQHDRAHIATFNPARVKALLDCVEALDRSCALLAEADKLGLYLVDSDKKEILSTGRAALKALESA